MHANDTLKALALVLLTAAPAMAETAKQEDCSYQAAVVAQVQQARLERVREQNVREHILEQQNDWPEKYDRVIPLVTPWVYEQRRRVIRENSLSDAWKELCLQQ